MASIALRRALQASAPAAACLWPTRRGTSCSVHAVPARASQQGGSVVFPAAGDVQRVGLKEHSDFVVFRRIAENDIESASSSSIPSAPSSQAPVRDLSKSRLANLEELFGTFASGSTLNDLRVVLLGEVHDDAIAHRLQLEVLQRLDSACREQKRRLVLSMEMFETDVQPVLDEYVLRKGIREADLLQDARPWGNYKVDYRPLVEFCREKGVRVVAANAPRRYVSLVARGGVTSLQKLHDELPASVKPRLPSLPPLPFPPASAAYRQKFIEAIAGQMPAADNGKSDEEGCPYIGFKARDVREAKPEMMEAQLLWDHSMAMSIAQALRQEHGEEQGPLVVHICGAFHCAHGLGIPEVLPLYDEMARRTFKSTETSLPTEPSLWLPIDSAFPAPQCSTQPRVVEDGPKESPPGVLSIVCWPGAVAETLRAARGGARMPSLGLMGDWVIVTSES